jgi:Aspartyl protease
MTCFKSSLVGGVGALIVFGFLVGLVSGCAGGSSLGFHRKPKRTVLTADRVALPTTRIDDFLFIDAHINGAGPFRLLVDTGAAGLVVSADAAKKAGIDRQTSSSIKQGFGESGVFNIHLARASAFESGGLTLYDLALMVDSEGILESFRVLYPSIDGILGVGPLADVLLEIDYPRSQISVLRAGSQVFPPETGCKYTVEEGCVPLVEIQLGKDTFPFIIDTGARDAALSLVEYDLNQADPALLYPLIKSGYAIGFGYESYPVKRAQVLGDVRIGPVTLRNPPVRTGQNALIGVQALRHWKIVLDQHARLVYFLGSERTFTWDLEKPPELQLRFGVTYEIEGTGLRLLDVDDDGNGAFAGLRKGDLISHINGEPAAIFIEAVAKERRTLSKIARVFRGNDGVEVHWVIGSATESLVARLLREQQPSDISTNTTKQKAATEARRLADEARKAAIKALDEASNAGLAASAGKENNFKALVALAIAKGVEANAARYKANVAEDMATTAQISENEKD